VAGRVGRGFIVGDQYQCSAKAANLFHQAARGFFLGNEVKARGGFAGENQGGFQEDRADDGEPLDDAAIAFEQLGALRTLAATRRNLIADPSRPPPVVSKLPLTAGRVSENSEPQVTE
jgi:hypothetical protein